MCKVNKNWKRKFRKYIQIKNKQYNLSGNNKLIKFCLGDSKTEWMQNTWNKMTRPFFNLFLFDIIRSRKIVGSSTRCLYFINIYFG